MKDHIIKTIKPKAKDFSAADAVDECFHWIVNSFAPEPCRQPSGTSQLVTNCNCARFLETNARKAMQVAEYLVHYAGMKRETKKEILHEWAKVSATIESVCPGNKLSYMVPGLPIAGAEEAANPMICRNALLGLLNEGRKSWRSAMQGPGIIDRRTGMKEDESSRGKANVEIYASLNQFFTELKQEALPFATRIIRDETGTTTRDDDPDDLVLPPHISKHSCFARWCYSRGWKVQKKSSALTIYTPVSAFERRPHDDDEFIPLWPQGSEYLRVVSWPTFLSYWKRKFPFIKLRKKGADTCTDCLLLCNEFRMRQARGDRRRAALQGNEEEEGTDTESEEEENGEDRDDEGTLEQVIETMAETIEKAREHVSSYQIQRNHGRQLISLARLDITHLLPSLIRRKVLTIDMGQNLCLPNFEAEQPGDTFYLSPLTVLLFGVVNNATEDGFDRMNAYIWREFEGDRGANNIASCLFKDLKRRGWLNGPNFGELTYIADNCGGQNKNKIVVRFLMWLVESNIFPRVRIFFLVKGHTKNAADRMFNLLKHTYHNKNIFSYDQLHDVLSSNQYVDVFQMRPHHFHNHLKWQDKHYRTPAQGEFKRTHVFTICKSSHGITGITTADNVTTTTLLKQDNNDSTIRKDGLLPTRRNRKALRLNPDARAREIAKMEENLEELVPTPLKAIKQVELWKKWAPLIPEKYRADTCPKPSDEVINSIKERNREKSKIRTKQKKLQTANESSSKISEKPK